MRTVEATCRGCVVDAAYEMIADALRGMQLTFDVDDPTDVELDAINALKRELVNCGALV